MFASGLAFCLCVYASPFYSPRRRTPLFLSSTSIIIMIFFVVFCFTLFQFLTHHKTIDYNKRDYALETSYTRKHRYLSADSSDLTVRLKHTLGECFVKCTTHLHTNTEIRKHKKEGEQEQECVRESDETHAHIHTLMHQCRWLTME